MVYRKEGVRVGPSQNGLGVFSVRWFQKRELLGPIQGTVMDDPLYESAYCMELGESSALEPAAPFRYMNHSCHPNCALVELEIEQEDGSSKTPELWVETLVAIAPGEQMTIDYAWPAKAAIPCHCGCPDCRGWIVAASEQDEVLGTCKHGPSSDPRPEEPSGRD